MDKKISVVIPTFRRPELLKKCLLALINQNFNKPDYEIIVVSDGPDESTESFVMSMPAPPGLCIRFLSLAEKQGPAAARNFGWQRATNNLIAFTDDDCLPDKDWLFTAAAAYKDEDLIVFS